MSGAIPTLPQYAFMAWCSFKAQIQLYAFLNSTLDGGKWSDSCPVRFIPGERAPGTYWIKGWVGLAAPLDSLHLL